MAIDGRRLGAPFDGYAAETGPAPAVPLGTVALAEGKHMLSLTVTGRNEGNGLARGPSIVGIAAACESSTSPLRWTRRSADRGKVGPAPRRCASVRRLNRGDEASTVIGRRAGN